VAASSGTAGSCAAGGGNFAPFRLSRPQPGGAPDAHWAVGLEVPPHPAAVAGFAFDLNPGQFAADLGDVYAADFDFVLLHSSFIDGSGWPEMQAKFDT